MKMSDSSASRSRFFIGCTPRALRQDEATQKIREDG